MRQTAFIQLLLTEFGGCQDLTVVIATHATKAHYPLNGTAVERCEDTQFSKQKPLVEPCCFSQLLMKMALHAQQQAFTMNTAATGQQLFNSRSSSSSSRSSVSQAVIHNGITLRCMFIFYCLHKILMFVAYTNISHAYINCRRLRLLLNLSHYLCAHVEFCLLR